MADCAVCLTWVECQDPVDAASTADGRTADSDNKPQLHVLDPDEAALCGSATPAGLPAQHKQEDQEQEQQPPGDSGAAKRLREQHQGDCRGPQRTWQQIDGDDDDEDGVGPRDSCGGRPAVAPGGGAATSSGTSGPSGQSGGQPGGRSSKHQRTRATLGFATAVLSGEGLSTADGSSHDAAVCEVGTGGDGRGSGGSGGSGGSCSQLSTAVHTLCPGWLG
ncbi:hypothetical protein HYH02_000762 [Chlamydomonas schloesseri]|uniref:Uncharacterized protein n=1 Tax=Chlamydomonas schloesseri TaxID=2026947 RepID=A0A835WV87_9CHLO|nr:hypothetical protein HYH02_000762 [Chlamydomonas schloesseri]|eukprot:KAG2454934.1 hypothetical protein HYH02_000762 [Chlamydomonas schloesseri]